MSLRGLLYGLSLTCLAAATACHEPTAPRSDATPNAHWAPFDRGDGLGLYGVGHTTLQFVHVGNAGEARPVDVHIWYPTWQRFGPRTEYTSRLFGLPLVPGTYDPLSFKVPSPRAREGVHIARLGPRFPLIIWSHGSNNDALDNAFTMENLASHGYVIAAPQHTGNSQDDVLTDFVNTTAGATVLACLDALPPPCSGGAIGPDVRNRVRDVSALIDAMGDWNVSRFASQVDLGRIGMMSHSRGTLTTFAAIAGSAANAIPIEPRISAAMTMATGNLALNATEMAQVKIPVVMLAGAADQNATLPAVRVFFDQLTGATRSFIVLRNGPHRAFNSGMCARMQATGAIRQTNPRALLEERIVNQLLINPLNGSSLDYCQHQDFIDPVDLTAFVTGVTGVDVSQTAVPRMLAADEVSGLVVHLATAFFPAAFARRQHLFVPPRLTPTILLREPIVESAETILQADAFCLPGLGCTRP